MQDYVLSIQHLRLLCSEKRHSMTIDLVLKGSSPQRLMISTMNTHYFYLCVIRSHLFRFLPKTNTLIIKIDCSPMLVIDVGCSQETGWYYMAVQGLHYEAVEAKSSSLSRLKVYRSKSAGRCGSLAECR